MQRRTRLAEEDRHRPVVCHLYLCNAANPQDGPMGVGEGKRPSTGGPVVYSTATSSHAQQLSRVKAYN